MRRLLVTAALAVVTLIPTAANAAPAVDPVFPNGLPYAFFEDGCAGAKRCVWDGRHQGNRTGHSLILTKFGDDYLAKRITHRRAHRLHEAWCSRPRVTCEGYWD